MRRDGKGQSVIGRMRPTRLLEVNQQGVTILLVEQNARLAFKLAQFIYVMEQGRVVLEGPSAEIARSEHVRRAYLGVA